MSIGRIHPTLLIIGLAIIIEHSLEVIMFDSELWRMIAHYMYELLT